jgi:hypothetical protein
VSGRACAPGPMRLMPPSSGPTAMLKAGKKSYLNNMFFLYGYFAGRLDMISLCRLIDPRSSTQWLPDSPGCCLG